MTEEGNKSEIVQKNSKEIYSKTKGNTKTNIIDNINNDISNINNINKDNINNNFKNTIDVNNDDKIVNANNSNNNVNKNKGKNKSKKKNNKIDNSNTENNINKEKNITNINQQNNKGNIKEEKNNKNNNKEKDNIINEENNKGNSKGNVNNNIVREKDNININEENNKGNINNNIVNENSKGNDGENINENINDNEKEDKDDDNEEGTEEDSNKNKAKKKNKKKKKAEPAKTDASKTKTKSGGQSVMGKRLAQAQQEYLKEQERIKKEQEEKERAEEEARQKAAEALRLAEEKKAREKQKKKERKQKLKQEGKLLTKTQQKKKAKNAESLKKMLLTENFVVGGGEVGKTESKAISPVGSEKIYNSSNGRISQGSNENLAEISEENRIVGSAPSEVSQKNSNISNNNFLTNISDNISHMKNIALLTNNFNNNLSNKNNDLININNEYVNGNIDSKYIDKKHIDGVKVDGKITLISNNIENIHISKPELRDEDCSKCDLRSPIVCVMGHVDTGKTKILDKLRNTHVQDGEAGGITQQIGVTNVPISIINQRIKHLPSIKDTSLRLCGLAIIDTPGHFSFRNLRSLGSSLCDIAILIVDLMHSIEPQTLESIKLLQEKKTSFVVALNKIDLITGWKSYPDKPIEEVLKLQTKPAMSHFEDLYKNTFTKFAELGINLSLAWNVGDNKKFVAAIPTSARTGDGINDLLSYICNFCQNRLESRLSLNTALQATVMEVKVISGLGATIDVILVNGRLNKGDRIVVPGIEGPIVTQIRALLTPPPMREMRVKASYIHHESISTCQGVKISAPNLDNAIAGLPIFVAHSDEEVEVHTNTLNSILEKAFSSFQKAEKGVYVHASTLGSLEALLHFLRESKIPYFNFALGPVHKKDVITTMTMLEHDPMYAVILAFDVKIDPDAQLIANKNSIKIFTANIIYHLFDQYKEYEKAYIQQQAEENRHKAVFPCVLQIIPENVFKTRDPIIVGVNVVDGTVRVGTPICVPSKNQICIGAVASIECNHKAVQFAKKGQDVCVKIQNIPGDNPKLLGRHFEITDQLVSKISRDSIDVMKKYFRHEMSKEDWMLVMNLKKTFGII